MLIEMKSISIMRLKLPIWVGISFHYILLKWKASQLWDWNVVASPTKPRCVVIEMKSISIMRLKHVWVQSLQDVVVLHWNEKHLNYEIETITVEWKHVLFSKIEMKSISIMRLKRIVRGLCRVYGPLILKWKASQLWDWNLGCGVLLDRI